MRILLDENLPRKLVAAFRAEDHEVESIQTLRMQGLDNGRLYQLAIQKFDLCFTRDFGFANNVSQSQTPGEFKFLRVTLPQKPQDEFVKDFISASGAVNVAGFQHGDDWPWVFVIPRTFAIWNRANTATESKSAVEQARRAALRSPESNRL